MQCHARFSGFTIVFGKLSQRRERLIGPLTRWSQEDTVWWFREHGVDLKTEEDGRIFPVSDSSQTVIDSLTSAARNGGVITKENFHVNQIIKSDDGGFHIYVNGEEKPIEVDFILIASGGIRSGSSRNYFIQLTINIRIQFHHFSRLKLKIMN